MPLLSVTNAEGSKLSDIKIWIDAPEYMQEFEKARRIRIPETGDWLLKNQVYQNWKMGQGLDKGKVPEIAAPDAPKALFVKGMTP